MYTPWSSPTQPPFPAMRDVYHALPRHTHTHTHAFPPHPPTDVPPRRSRRRPTTHLHVHHAPPSSVPSPPPEMQLPLGLGINGPPGGVDLSATSDAEFFDSDSSWDAHGPPARAELRHVSLRVPHASAARLGTAEVLVLPREMVPLRVQVRGRGATEVVRALVPGEMRMRDAARQVVGEGRVLMRWRGRWEVVGGGTRVEECVGRGRYDEERAADVLVEGVPGEREEVREGPRWERSRDVERMRVY